MTCEQLTKPKQRNISLPFVQLRFVGPLQLFLLPWQPFQLPSSFAFLASFEHWKLDVEFDHLLLLTQFLRFVCIICHLDSIDLARCKLYINEYHVQSFLSTSIQEKKRNGIEPTCKDLRKYSKKLFVKTVFIFLSKLKLTSYQQQKFRTSPHDEFWVVTMSLFFEHFLRRLNLARSFKNFLWRGLFPFFFYSSHLWQICTKLFSCYSALLYKLPFLTTIILNGSVYELVVMNPI